MSRKTTEQFIEGMAWSEKREFAAQMSNWLTHYTQDVYVKVMGQFEDIINNPFAMDLINELYIREKKEIEDEIGTMDLWLGNVDHFKEFNPHNHCLTHSKSYRDILYDMFIRDK